MRTAAMALFVATLGAVGASAQAAPAPRAFGTGNVASYEITPLDFSPISSSVGFLFHPLPSPFGLQTSSPYGSFFASPALPAGAQLLSLNVSYCNGNPPGGDDFLVQLVDTDAENNFLSTLGSILAQAGDLCMQKSFDLSGLNYTVNNASHRLLLFVIFGPNPTNSAFVTIGSTTLSYRLQVSPPPDSPTFSDVPAADLAFQYIEALAASGISAGCGGGKFCPDSPVTRRQMAVFLSKALGLSHNFGTTNPTYFTIPEWEFRPQVSSLVYADTGPPQRSRFASGGSILGFGTEISLPAGAILDALEFQYCDDAAGGSPFQLLLQDQSLQVLGAITTTPGQGCASTAEDLSGLQYTVGDSKLYLSVNLVPPAAGEQQRFQGATISYRLQVSPPPATPTFGDVPTTDAGFQYIEALAASGITGGCGGANFCPANPVTRRQMAVFLAKSLGLSYN